MSPQHVQAAARYQAIEAWLTAEGRLDVVDMAARLGVAQETIRRDLRTMETERKLQRVHGGAVRMESGPGPLLSAPVSSEQDALELSVRVWSQLPRHGTILLGSGALGLALAQTILASPPESSGLTIVTNSLDAAVLLSRASRLEVYNIGGTVSPVTRAQEGDWAVVEMERLHVDVSVVCPAGVSVERGLTQATPAAAAVSQVEVASGQWLIALATPAILGTSAFVQFAGLAEIDLLALSGSPDGATLQPFVERGIAISTAAVPA